MVTVRLTLEVPDTLFRPIEVAAIVTEAGGEEVELDATEYPHAPDV